MSALEIVGFIIAFFVFLFLQSSKRHSNQRRDAEAELPSDGYEDHEDPLVKLLSTLDRKSPKEKKREGEALRQVPKQKTEQQRSLEHAYKQRRTSPSLESLNQQHRPSLRTVKHPPPPVSASDEREHHYTVTETRPPSRAKEIIRTLPLKQNLVIYQEIMGKPKSLRTEEWL